MRPRSQQNQAAPLHLGLLWCPRSRWEPTAPLHPDPLSRGRARSGNMPMRSSQVGQASPKTSSSDGIEVSQEFFCPFVLTNFCHKLTVMSFATSEDVGLF